MRKLGSADVLGTAGTHRGEKAESIRGKGAKKESAIFSNFRTEKQAFHFLASFVLAH